MTKKSHEMGKCCQVWRLYDEYLESSGWFKLSVHFLPPPCEPDRINTNIFAVQRCELGSLIAAHRCDVATLQLLLLNVNAVTTPSARSYLTLS